MAQTTSLLSPSSPVSLTHNAFTETLAASAIPLLDETPSQVIAPAIAANQLV
jgi:hypothetical protein